jgi:methylase of polypeptide subunit release factors
MVRAQEEDEVVLLYDSVRLAIQSNNKESLLEQLSKIKDIEETFLHNYTSRKEEGVYFTQKYISDFIVSQTLLEFFRDKGLEEKSLNEIKPGDERILNIISEATFCDPACGSGIFLLSLINTLFNLINKDPLTTEKKKLKHRIIKNISGFDINPISVKLTILKLLKRILNESNPVLDLKHYFKVLENNISIKNVIKHPPLIKFDVIVGNPPYGNILDEDLKNFLKEKKIFTKDIYCVFLSLALRWSKGIIGFLIPKSFLLRQSYLNFRNSLLSKANLLRIIDIGPNIFKGATNEVQVLIFERRVNGKKNLKVSSFPNEEVIIYNEQIFDDLKVCRNSECLMTDRVKKIYPYTKMDECPFCHIKTVPLNRIRIKSKRNILKLANKIESKGDVNYINIKDFPKFIRGEEHKGLKAVKEILTTRLNQSCYFINAKDDFDYYLMRKNKSFDIETINPNTLKGDAYEYYKNRKLLIKHNNIIPQALYSEENVCFTSSIYSILHKDPVELKFLCGVINSAVIQFYCLFAINNQTDTTINLNQYMIRHFPIINPERTVKEEISEKVDFIMKYLEHEKELDETTYYCIREVDKILFDLYSLTELEQKQILSSIIDKIDFYNKVYEKDYDFIFEREWTKIKRAPNF